MATVELVRAGHRAGSAWGGRSSSARPTSGSATGRGRSCGSSTAWSTPWPSRSSPRRPATAGTPTGRGAPAHHVPADRHAHVGLPVSAVLDDMSLIIMWERWEGTIEHTFMAPVSRVSST